MENALPAFESEAHAVKAFTGQLARGARAAS